jgi:hypothetical protein
VHPKNVNLLRRSSIFRLGRLPFFSQKPIFGELRLLGDMHSSNFVVGFDPDTFEGPCLTSLSLSVYVVPLPVLLLELNLGAKASSNPTFRTAVGLVTLLMGWA